MLTRCLFKIPTVFLTSGWYTVKHKQWLRLNWATLCCPIGWNEGLMSGNSEYGVWPWGSGCLLHRKPVLLLSFLTSYYIFINSTLNVTIFWETAHEPNWIFFPWKTMRVMIFLLYVFLKTSVEGSLHVYIYNVTLCLQKVN